MNSLAYVKYHLKIEISFKFEMFGEKNKHIDASITEVEYATHALCILSINKEACV